jgi:hypothetical protein
VEEGLLKPLCRAIENELRKHVHSVHLDHMAAPNMKDPRDPKKALGRFLDLPTVRLFGTKGLSVRQYVTHYLEDTFYNLTTVALHDWKTYSEMRNLAYEKYGLELGETHLPMGSLDTGLDVLQIMRNIHVFVARYNYNLNQQTFLERRTDKGSKNLNSINIHSIASSIRTHGMGMLNTTVNYTYHFLAKKFNIFSQFLFDEYIKSFLQRERRWFKKHRDDEGVEQQYPYANAFQVRILSARVRARADAPCPVKTRSHAPVFAPCSPELTVTELTITTHHATNLHAANLTHHSGLWSVPPPPPCPMQFNKEIRKLGVDKAGRTYLDQFRILVTEIGNALGYVRMVRR